MSNQQGIQLENIRCVATQEVISNLLRFMNGSRNRNTTDLLDKFEANLESQSKRCRSDLTRSTIELHKLIFTELVAEMKSRLKSLSKRNAINFLKRNLQRIKEIKVETATMNKKTLGKRIRFDSEDDEDGDAVATSANTTAAVATRVSSKRSKSGKRSVHGTKGSNTKRAKRQDDSDYDSDESDVDHVIVCDGYDADDGTDAIDLGDDDGASASDSDNDSDSSDSDSVNDLRAMARKFAKRYIGKTKMDKELCEYVELRSSMNGGDIEPQDIQYFKSLSKQEKVHHVTLIKNLRKENGLEKPLVFQLLDKKMNDKMKAYVMRKVEVLTSMEPSSSEYNKLRQWIEAFMRIPTDTYAQNKMLSKKNIKSSLEECKDVMENTIYGHDQAKNKFLQIFAQKFKKKDALGTIIGIEGPPGNGKTTLVKDGVCKCLGLPLAFISLGGKSTGSYLDGHDYTYEGSRWGEVMNQMMRVGVNNPVFLFDEADKVSDTERGHEVVNVLMHLIDQSQNTKFKDNYFDGVEFDMSKCTFVFTFNDRYRIDPILRDRMEIIETSGFRIKDKVPIAQNYLFPAILPEVGLKDESIIIPDSVVEFIVSSYTHEGGVRKLKELLTEISKEVNLRKLSGKKILKRTVQYPIEITRKMIEDDLFMLKNKIVPERIHGEPTIGRFNGMYASSGGHCGGIIPIECKYMLSDNASLPLKTTGNLGKVITESTEVAKTLSWEYLTIREQKRLRDSWKAYGTSGLHIHTPDAAVEKDGPSAGAAITITVMSRLLDRPVRNDVAMTGEIDLQGNITQIGGLRDKLDGAKRAGIKLALYPVDNQGCVDKLKITDPDLIDDSFQVKAVGHLDEVIDLVFCDE